MDKLLDKAKVNIMLNQDLAFYSTIMCSLDFDIDDTINPPTACTNGVYIKFHPDYIQTLDSRTQESLIIHESLHVVMEHTVRRMDNHELFNIACDYWINDHIKNQLKMPIGKGWLIDAKYDSEKWSAEEIYHDLMQNSQQQQGGGSGTPNPLGGDLQHNADPQVAQDIKDMVVKAATQARVQGAGKLPSSIERLVEELLNPKVDYRILFMKYMTEKAKDDYSWLRRSRRYEDIYMPGRHSEKMGSFDFYIDGSCSVSDEDFSMQVSQIKWVWNNLEPSSIRIIVFNTQIVDIFEFKEGEPMKVKFNARGGTDVECIRDEMLKSNPECSVIYTDGYFPEQDFSKVGHDVLWLIYQNPNFSHKTGKVIYID